MRKYYLEVESYKHIHNRGLLGISIVDQKTKNRREEFGKKLSRTGIEHFEILRETPEEILQTARDFAHATKQLIDLKVKEIIKAKDALDE